MRTVSLRVPAPLLVTALTALTVAACASSSRPAPAACTPAGLRVTAAYIQGATQHAIYGLRFTNVSRTACKLTGYPAVSLVTAANSSGRPIGSPRPLIMHSPGSVKTATLAPGQHALALLAVAEIVLFTGASCNPVLAHWLRVYPPHLRHAVYLPIKAHTCSSPPGPGPGNRPGLPRFLNHSLPSKPGGGQRQSQRIRPGQNNARPQRQMRTFTPRVPTNKHADSCSRVGP